MKLAKNYARHLSRKAGYEKRRNSIQTTDNAGYDLQAEIEHDPFQPILLRNHCP